MKTLYTFDTASSEKEIIARAAAAEYGLGFMEEYRPTCFKKYHFDVIAYTPEEDEILTLMILALVDNNESEKYRKKLLERIAEKRVKNLIAA